MNFNKFFSSRTRGIPVILGIVIIGSIVIGQITGKPFDLKWLWALLPYIGFVFSEINKKKNIKVSEILAAKKFREKRWITGLITALLPLGNWIYYLITGTQLSIAGETIAMIAGFITLLLSAFQGGDLSELVQAAGDMQGKRKGRKK